MSEKKANNEKKELKTCPKCNKTYTGYPAISRRDNKTEICSEGETKEALEDYENYLKEEKKN